MAISKSQACSKCGYYLMGLSKQSNCPECGQYFNKETGKGIKPLPVGKKEKANQALARVRTVCLVFACVMVMVCGTVIGLITSSLAKSLAVAGSIAAVFLLGEITSFVYERYD